MTDLPLWVSSPDPDRGDRGLELLRERLKTLAGELALKAGRHGVTVSDVRIAAESAGLLNGQESTSYMKRLNLGAIMPAAGLCRSDRFRRSNVGRSHGNAHVIWTLREFSEAVA